MGIRYYAKYSSLRNKKRTVIGAVFCPVLLGNLATL